MRDAKDMSGKTGTSVPESTLLNALILRSIVDHAVVTMDAAGIITSWNEGAELILGWTEMEIVGKSADVFFTPQDVEENRPETEMRLAIENGRAADVRWHVRKSGERFWGDGLMMPFLAGTDPLDGGSVDPEAIDGFVKIFRDRTAERDAEIRMSGVVDRAALAMRRSGTIGSYDLDLCEGIVVADEAAARMHSVDVDLAGGGTPIETFFQAIVEEDRDAVRTLLSAAFEKGSDFEATYRVVTDGPRPVWVQSEGMLQRDDTGEPARLVGIVVDVTEQRHHLRLQDAQLEFSEQVRNTQDIAGIVELASRMIGEALYVDRVGIFDTGPGGETMGTRADWTSPDRRALADDLNPDDFEIFAPKMRAGETVVIRDASTDSRGADQGDPIVLEKGALVCLPLMENGLLKAVLFARTAAPRDWSQVEIAFLKKLFDRTYSAIERLQSEAEREVLVEEVAHRMKNVLAVAQVIVKQSLRHVPEIEGERRSIEARLSALAGAQDVLTRAQDREADILSVIETTMGPYLPQQGRIEISGMSTPLTSDQVLGLSLALHELATNAAKYGALSNDDGRVLMSWNVDETGRFTFSWTERDGPEVKATDHKGFGSTILERIVGGYFSGSTTLDLEPDGVRFEIDGGL